MVQLIQSVENLWDEWDIRLVVVGSLCLQIFLILFGSRRKYTAKNWIRILVWIVYLSADWVATFALGAISNFQGSDTGTPNEQNSSNPADSNRSFILDFWAPFLLLHLGGPDTITAYAMEDNDLWLRHLLSLLVQVSLALYIFSRLWMSRSYRLPLLAIPILVAGTIKYGERNWVLRSVSKMNIENMVSKYKDTKPRVDSSNDPNGGDIENMVSKYKDTKPRVGSSNDPNGGDARFLRECSEFLVVVMYLYKDLADSTTWKATSYSSYSSRDLSREEDWLKQVELVLGFMYDLLYTKAKLVYSATGIIIRCVSLICCIATFSAFSLLIDKKLYSDRDIIVSYLLMIGAIVLELYAIIVIFFTDWTQYWLRSRQQKCSCPQLVYPTFHAISSVRSKLSYDKTWSETVAQFNLIDFCTKREKSPCARITGLIGIAETIEKEWHLTSVDVPNRVKQLIFSQLLKNRIESGFSLNVVLGWRGTNALRENECSALNWSISPQYYGRSIALWHIATDICYYDDRDRGKLEEDGPPDNSRYFKLGMLLSDYMAYILIMQHFLLPGNKFKADCFEYRLIFAQFFKTRADLLSFPELRHLSEVQEYSDVTTLASEMANTAHLDMSSDSRQYDWRTWVESIRLAQQIQLLEARGKLTNEKKWKMITEVWIETLCYAALQCPWIAHAKQLRRGGELLTYVHLVMAKLGINNSFRELSGG